MSLFYTITSFFWATNNLYQWKSYLIPPFSRAGWKPNKARRHGKHSDTRAKRLYSFEHYTHVLLSTILMCGWVLYSCAVEYYTHVRLSTILMCGWVLYCDFDWLYLTSMWANLPIRINIAPSFITYEYNNITMPLRVFLMVRSKNPLLLIDTLQKLFISKRKVLYTEYYQIENNSLLLRC